MTAVDLFAWGSVIPYLAASFGLARERAVASVWTGDRTGEQLLVARSDGDGDVPAGWYWWHLRYHGRGPDAYESVAGGGPLLDEDAATWAALRYALGVDLGLAGQVEVPARYLSQARRLCRQANRVERASTGRPVGQLELFGGTR